MAANKRPTYSTEAILAALETYHGKINLAAQELGCNRRTIDRRAKSDPRVLHAIEHFRERIVDVAELRLEDAVLAGERWAVRFMLETRGKDRGYTRGVKVNGDVSARIKLSWDEIRNEPIDE